MEPIFGKTVSSISRWIVFHGDEDRDVLYNDTNIPWTAFGNEGDDLLSGGSNNDILVGGPGRDELLGNNGHDHLMPGSDFEEGRVDGGFGTNTCEVRLFWTILPGMQIFFVEQSFDLLHRVIPIELGEEVHWSEFW